VALPESFGPPSADDPAGRTIAQGQRLQLLNLGFDNAVLILSTDYPQLQPGLAKGSWLAVIPGFPNPQAAIDACNQAGLTCTTYAPGPVRPDGPPPESGPATG
jgi:hypothetical protein